MNQLSKKTTGFIRLAIMSGIFLLIMTQCTVPQDIRNITIHTPNLKKTQDGNYLGMVESRMVKAEVLVRIKNHKIQNIDIIKHETGLGKKAEVLADSVLKYQTIEINAVSGATASSKVILKAIEKAINSSIK